MPDNTSNSGSVTLTQAAKYVVSTAYRNLSVSISASPASVDAAGGSSTLSCSATWEYQHTYSDSSVGEWTADSGTPNITGSATGFSRSGTAVTVAANPNSSSRSVTYTATYTLPDNTSNSSSVTITQGAKYVVSTAYRNLSVSIGASRTSVGASGGTSTLNYSASWEYRHTYSDSSVGDWTADSGTPGISGSATGFSRSGASVTVAENPNYSARSVTYTATYTLPDNTSNSSSVTITQAAKEKYVVSTSYRNLSVWISASPTSVGASGGSSTLSYGASWEYRHTYSDSSVGSWTSDSGTPDITGSATGFSRSGASVTVSANPNYSSRSVTYTATYTLPNNASSSAQATITQAAKEKYVVSTSYRNLNVWITASPASIDAAGGNSTLSYGASWEYRYNYSDSSVGSWIADSGTPDITGSATGFSRSGASVTAGANPNSSSRSVTYTATYTLPDNTSNSSSATITQGAKYVVSTAYRNLSVSISASPTSIAATGGSSTLSYGASWEYRYAYSDGSYGSWTSDSGTPNITGSATGFTRNGTAVTVAANPNTSSRSVTYTATYILPDNTSKSGSAKITQDATVITTEYDYKLEASANPTDINVGQQSALSAKYYTRSRQVVNNVPGSWGDWNSGESVTPTWGGVNYGSISGNTYTATAGPGSDTFTATYGGKTSNEITITVHVVTTEYDYKLEISAGSTEINVGGTSALSARYYTRSRQVVDGVAGSWGDWNSGESVTPTWSGGSHGGISGNTYTGTADGSDTLTATYGGKTSNSITITVHKVLTSISLSGFPTSTMLIGGFFTPSVTAHFNGAPDETVTGSVTWSNYSGILSWNGTRFTATTGGSTSVTASYTYRGTTKTASESVTVEAHRWAITIQRINNSSIKVFAEYDNEEPQDITGSVTIRAKTNVTVVQSSESVMVTAMSADTGSFGLRWNWLPAHTEDLTVNVTRTGGYIYIIVP